MQRNQNRMNLNNFLVSRKKSDVDKFFNSHYCKIKEPKKFED